MQLKTGTVAGIKIYTADQFDGYGLQSLSDFINSVRQIVGGKKFQNALEWCCGPGYFGFMLHRYGIAKNVTLVDIHDPLEQAINQTIKENLLEESIKFVCSNNFQNVQGTFDLIVGNPPHFNVDLEETEETIHYNEHRKFIDLDWQIHQDFFNNVGNYLSDDGSIILMENAKGSDPSVFFKMIEDNDLKINNVIKSLEFPNDIWYMEIIKK
jgi:methylase of polypeptide subunit release factors